MVPGLWGGVANLEQTLAMSMKTRPQSELRRHPRFRVGIDGELRVPLAEYGSAVLKSKATVEDVSLGGAKIRMHKLKREHSHVIMHRRRQCTMSCQFPGADAPSLLNGEIVWADLRSDESRPRAYLGMEFTGLSSGDQARLDAFIEQISKRYPWLDDGPINQGRNSGPKTDA
jgi:hypothetical protein